MKKTYFLIIFALLISTVFAEEAPKFIYNDELFEIGDTNSYILEKLGAPNRIYYEAWEYNSDYDLVSYEYKDEDGEETVFHFFRKEEKIIRITSSSRKFGISYQNTNYFCHTTSKNNIDALLGKGILVYVQEDGTKIYEYEYSNEYTKWFTFLVQFFYDNNELNFIYATAELW